MAVDKTCLSIGQMSTLLLAATVDVARAAALVDAAAGTALVNPIERLAAGAPFHFELTWEVLKAGGGERFARFAATFATTCGCPAVQVFSGAPATSSH